MNAKVGTVALVVLLLSGCGTEKKDWRKEMVCVATIPGIPDDPAGVALDETFKNHRIWHMVEGSVAWTIYVRPEQAELARSVLRTNDAIVIVGERNGVLEIRAKAR